MERLWEWDRPASVRDVLSDLERERVIAYTTVMTVLDNLHRKGMVAREKRGRAFVYRCVQAKANYIAELMDRALSEAPDRDQALLHFVRRRPPEELRELRRLLEGMSTRGVVDDARRHSER
uniref:BlaI/MecI/CopY family transcriptional regulator n=1 Tax=Nocardioides sp. T2.26MG-1 TaxID=3041166 RepID=UPI002540DD88|nr:BlaI/MecI/CopY family transcriptional regulator [Nocardioides sp. T2.26MG-1]